MLYQVKVVYTVCIFISESFWERVFVSEESETRKVNLWAKEYGSRITTEREYLHFSLQGRQQNLLKAKNKSFYIKTSVLTMEKFSTNWPILLGKELAVIEVRVTNSIIPLVLLLK